MKYFNTIRNDAGISHDLLREKFPSVFAKRQSPKVSERYQFLSTAALLEATKDQFMVVEARQRAVRADGRNPLHTRHMLKLRKIGVAKPTHVGGVVPEICLSNSHDGQSRYVLGAGLFRLVCLNGLIVPFGPAGMVSVRHTAKALEALQEMDRVLQIALDASTTVEKMVQKKLTKAKQQTFAQKAAVIAYEKPDFDTSLLLAPRRVEDEGDNVWQVLNRVQENIIRGGISLPATNDRRATALRGITHIGRDTSIKMQLWSLAEATV